jgi:hypothetical protein
LGGCEGPDQLIELGRDLAALCRILSAIIRKRQFSELRSEAQRHHPRRRRDHLSTIGAKTFQQKIVLWLGEAGENPAVRSSGVLARQPS